VGFTLIEVMIAVTILAIGMVAVLRGYAVSINTLEGYECSVDIYCLLKERLAGLEEKIIKEKGLLPETDTGKYRDRYDGFKWKMQVTNMYIETVKEELREELNKFEMTVFNDKRKPARKFSVTGYVDNQKEQEEDLEEAR